MIFTICIWNISDLFGVGLNYYTQADNKLLVQFISSILYSVNFCENYAEW